VTPCPIGLPPPLTTSWLAILLVRLLTESRQGDPKPGRARPHDDGASEASSRSPPTPAGGLQFDAWNAIVTATYVTHAIPAPARSTLVANAANEPRCASDATRAATDLRADAGIVPLS